MQVFTEDRHWPTSSGNGRGERDAPPRELKLQCMGRLLLQRGFKKSASPPIAREGSLWGESGQSGFLTGQNVHRPTGGRGEGVVTLIS